MSFRPIVFIMPIAAVLCSCERPTSEPPPPPAEAPAEPPSGDTLSEQLSTLQNTTRQLETRLSDPVFASGELANYFKESLSIIQRSLGYIQSDLKKGNVVNAGIGLKEAAFLTSFLEEELDVHAQREAATPRQIDVTTFGLMGDGQTDNFSKFKTMLAELKRDNQHVELLFPEGDYVVKMPKNTNGITISEQRNLTFKGLGRTRFLFDASQGGSHNIAILNSTNIAFRNISIDMDPTPFTLGTILSVPSGNQILVEINEGYPEPDDSYAAAVDWRGVVRNPRTGQLDKSYGDPRIREIKSMGDARYLLTLDDNAKSNNQTLAANFKVGDYFAIHPRQRPYAGNGLHIEDSQHILLANFNIRAADNKVFLVLGSKGVKFLDCTAEPGEGRLPLNNSDGFHCGSNLKGVYVDRCKVMNTNDDCLAFFTRLHSVGRVLADNQFLIVAAVAGSLTPQNYQVGDAVAFVHANSGQYDGVTSVKSVKEFADGSGKNKHLLIETVDPVPNLISRESVGRDLEIRDREYVESGGDNYRRAMALNAPYEHQIVNLSRKNDGWIVLNSEFGHNRANGFRVKAPNGVLRNTRFHDQVILLTSEFDWWGGIYPEKIEITDVTVDKGIVFQAMLPGARRMDNEQLAKYMRHIHLNNVKSASGTPITLPW